MNEYMFDTDSWVADEQFVIECDMRGFLHDEDVRWAIHAATFAGAHFDSESFDDLDEATENFRKYESVVSYFGGGRVELLEYNDMYCSIKNYSWMN